MDRQDLSGARAWLQRAKEVGWGGAPGRSGHCQCQCHKPSTGDLSMSYPFFKDYVMGWFMAIGCNCFAIVLILFEHVLHPNSSTWLYYLGLAVGQHIENVASSLLVPDQAGIDLNGDAMGNILKQLMRTWPRVNGWGPVGVWDWWGLYPYSRNQMRSQGATESFLQAYSCR